VAKEYFTTKEFEDSKKEKWIDFVEGVLSTDLIIILSHSFLYSYYHRVTK